MNSDIYRQLKDAGAVEQANLILKGRDWQGRETEGIFHYLTYYFDKDGREIGYVSELNPNSIFWISRVWSSEFRAAHRFRCFD